MLCTTLPSKKYTYKSKLYKNIKSCSVFLLLILLALLPSNKIFSQTCNCTNAVGCTPNPDFSAVCESLKVILVLDESGSIGGAESNVEAATLAFLNGLAGTGAKAAIVDFSTTATTQFPFTTVNTGFINNVTNYLTCDDLPISCTSGSYNSSGWTNWESALDRVITLNSTMAADLVVFITDGNPTTYGNGSNTGSSSSHILTSLRKACDEANVIKSSGSHIFALGVGSGINSGNLQSISGGDLYNGSNFATADYSLTTNFDQLKDDIKEIAVQVCGTTLEIDKDVDLCYRKVGNKNLVDFTLKVKNTGSPNGLPATNVSVTDDLESGYSYVSVTPGHAGSVSHSGGLITWDGFNLTVMQERTLVFTVEVISGQTPDDYKNMVEATADNALDVAGVTLNAPQFDDEAPDIENIPDVTLSGCNSAWPGPYTTTWTDNLPPLSGSVTSDNGGPITLLPDGCTQQRTYTFTVEDACGNESTSELVVTRDYDETPPEIVDIPDYSLTGCNTDWPVTLSTTWTDNCSGGGNLISNGGINGSSNGCLQTRVYTFTVTDNCGKSDTEQTTVARKYNIIAPEIVDIADYTLTGCNTDWPATISTTWTDNCSGGGNLVSDGGIDGATTGCSQTRIYTFTVTDDCGNSDTEQTTVTRKYNLTAPEIVDIPDYTLTGCNTDWPVTLSTTWTDHCSGGGNLVSDGGIAGVTTGCSQTRIYTFTVTDDCGNSDTEKTTVTRKYNETAPEIVDIADYTLTGCNTDWPVTLSTTWTDHCSGGGNLISDGGLDGITTGCMQTRIYTFTVTDDCGNSDTEQTTVTRKYNETAPEIVDIPNYTLTGCNTDWPTTLSTTWTDHCSGGGNLISDGGIIGVTNGCLQTRVYTFTVTDDCGNSDTEKTTVTRKYNETAPEIVDISNYTLIGCNTDWPITLSTTWTDNCSGGGTLISDGGIDGATTGCSQTRIYTFTVTDDCGNSDTEQTTLTRKYNETAPEIVDIANYTLIGCNTEWPATLSTTWTDNCSGGGNLVSDGGIDGTTTGCSQIRIYTFTVTDDCGNSDTEKTTVTRKYNVTAPEIVDIADYTLTGCNTDWPVTLSTTWTDNCSGDGNLVSDGGIDGATTGCSQTRIYTFTVTDDCGNSDIEKTTVSRVFNVTAPEIVDLPDYTLSGCNIDWPATLSTTYAENCTGGGNLVSDGGVDGSTIGCMQTRIYTFTVTDPCGENSDKEQTTVTRKYNVTAPEILDIADYTLTGCNTEWPVTLSTTWTDNCSGGGNLISDGGLDGTTTGCSQTRIYTFTVTDDCGNSDIEKTTVTRKYNVTAPEIVDIADYTLTGCNTDWPVNLSTTWTDDCSGGGNLVSDAGIEGTTTGCSQTRIYTFRVTDDCGNSDTEQTTVTRKYNVTAPEILDIADYTLTGCNTDWPVTLSTTWTDNCSGGGTLVSDGGIDGVTTGCMQTRIYTFIVTDDCGNSDTEKTTVTRKYNVTAPEIVDLADYNLTGCNADWPSTLSTTWTDNCSGGGNLISDGGIDGVTTGCSQTRIYTFTVTDDCRNSDIEKTTVSRVFNVTAPEIVDLPDYTLTGCNTDWPATLSTTYAENCTGGGNLVSDGGVDGATIGCMQTRIYTFTVTDPCGGNSDTEKTTVTRKYNVTAPEIVDIADYTLTGCNTDWPVSLSTTWSDNCSGGGTLVSDGGVDGVTTGCSQTRIFTFTVTDDCGNSDIKKTTVSRVFNVTAPEILDIPDYTLEGCNTAWPSTLSTTYTENCTGGGNLVSDGGVDGATVGCMQTRIYTFTVTDACGGNSDTEKTTITRKYNVTAPEIVDIADYTLTGCNTDWPATLSTTWTDNCTGGGNLVSDGGVEGTTIGCMQTRIYTFTVTDDCGNSDIEKTTVTRKYNVTAPEIVDIADYTLTGCNTDWPVTLSTTWTDNCLGGGNLVSDGGIEGTSTGCSQTRIYTFIVTDDCGNSDTEQTTVTRKYNVTAPEIVDLADYTLEGCNTAWPAILSSTWTDNCSGGGTLVSDGGIDGTTTGCSQTRIYTFTVTDDCGNSDTEKTTVTRKYNVTAPEIVDIADYTLTGCNTDWPVTLSTTWTDNCSGGGTLVSDGGIDGTTTGCMQTRIYTFTVTDDCGNSDTEQTTVTRKYNVTAPEIVDLADYTLEGCNTAWPVTLSTTWTDNCSGGGNLVSDGGVDGTTSGCLQTRIYTFIVTDDCGNSDTEQTTVTRKYNVTAPEILDIPDYTLEGCNTAWPVTLSTTWTDNCSGGGNLVSDGGVDGNASSCLQTRVYTFTVTDDCGNSDTESVIVSRTVDTEKPILTCPSDQDGGNIELGCNPEVGENGIPTAIPLTVTWTDNCDGSGSTTLNPVDSNVDLLGCDQSITRTYSYTDNCGQNTGECSVTYTWTEDKVIPVITSDLASKELGCNPEITPPTFSVTDNCDEEEESEEQEVEEDKKGNSNITDNKTGSILSLNNGDLVADVTDSGSIAGEGCSFSRTWTANYTDACGNVAETVEVKYTWTEDETAPVITPVSDGGYLGCEPLEIPVPIFSISDNCMPVDITVEGVPGIITRDECVLTQIWTADYTDPCKNKAVQSTVTYTWKDPLEDLTIGFVNEMLIEVGDGGTLQIQCFGQNPEWSVPEATINDVTISGGCGVITPTVSEVEIADGECATDGFIKRFLCTWSAIDECDNEVSLYVYMEIIDELPPLLFGIPADVTVACDAIPAIPEVTATDECLCADVEMTESVITAECLDGQVIVRTWTASDCCGNVTVETQSITLTDKVAPELVISLPNGLEIKDNLTLDFDCNTGGIPAIYDNLSVSNANALEACSGIPTFTFGQAINVNSVCAGGALDATTYTWTVMDACGNAKSIVLTLRTIDTTPPQIMGLQSKVCEADIPLIYSLDNCTNSFMEFFDVEIEGSCGNEFLRTFYATDVCGNGITATQVIIREDNIAPEIELINPLLVNAENGDTIILESDSQLKDRYTNYSIVDANFIDECDGELATSFAEEMEKESNCDSEEGMAMVKLTWAASDVCGNETSITLYAKIVDTQAPVIQNFEPSITVSCTREVPQIIVLDNSGFLTAFIDENVIPGSCPGNYQIERLIFAEDRCGNSVSATQMVTVVDQIGPFISGVEEFICEDLSIPEVTAIDDCSAESISVSMVQDTIQNVECTSEILIRRTWTATDLCGNSTVVEQVISFNDNTAPDLIYVEEIKPFIGQSTEIMMSDLNTMALIEDFASYSVVSLDRCPGQFLNPEFSYNSTLSVDCIAEGFYEKRNYIWLFTDACGNTSSQDMELIIIDNVAPPVGNLPLDQDFGCNGIPIIGNLEPPEFSELVDSMTGTITFTEVEETDDIYTTITNIYTAVDMCGNTTVVSQLLSAIVASDIACSISKEDDINCNSHGNILSANVTGGDGPYTYVWKIEGKDCQIQTGQGTSSIEIYVGFSDVLVTLIVTDVNNCSTTCEIDISCISKGGDKVVVRSEDSVDSEPVKINALMPNPATENVSFTVHSNKVQEIRYNLINIMNQKIMSKSTTLDVGENRIDLNINDYEVGIYYIMIENNESSDIKRFIKVR